MGRASESQSQATVNIFNDKGTKRDEVAVRTGRYAALAQISVAESQNRQSARDSGASVESITTDSPKKLHSSNENFELNAVKPKYRSRLSRPTIAPDTFNCLQTVPELEGELQASLEDAESGLATPTQRCFEIPGIISSSNLLGDISSQAAALTCVPW